jgi:hypothetical protein
VFSFRTVHLEEGIEIIGELQLEQTLDSNEVLNFTQGTIYSILCGTSLHVLKP